jgi:sec-independent protein translocase protein TatA
VPNIGVPELIVILVLALVVFGPKRLPEIGRTIGKSLREFRRASSELRQELRIDLEADDEPSVPPPRTPPPGQTALDQVAAPSDEGAWKGRSLEDGGPSTNGTGPRR